MPNHWILRVKDGQNFRNSKHPFWGVKRGNGGGVKTIVKSFQPGDILWFLTSSKYGGSVIAMAEYTCFYDRQDEKILHVHTYTNVEQGWKGDDDWDIQIHYTNVYKTEKQNIKMLIQCAGAIVLYDTFREKIAEDLYKHHEFFTKYAEPVAINPIGYTHFQS